MSQPRPLPTGVPGPGRPRESADPPVTILKWALRVLLALVLLALAFSAGRFTAPVQVSERVEYKTLAVEDITRGFTFAKRVEVIRWRNVVTQITDAGTTITDSSGEHEGALTSGTGAETAKRSEAAEGSTVKTVTLRPEWRISGQVGASLVTPALPITGPLVVGVSVERRIIGGVSAGLWGNTVGAGGIVVSGEF